MLGVSWIDEQKLVPEKGLCSAELVQTFISDSLRTSLHKQTYSVCHRLARCNSRASKQSSTWPHCSSHPILLSTWWMCAACHWRDGLRGCARDIALSPYTCPGMRTLILNRRLPLCLFDHLPSGGSLVLWRFPDKLFKKHQQQYHLVTPMRPHNSSEESYLLGHNAV
jgi:hypothetical protein